MRYGGLSAALGGRGPPSLLQKYHPSFSAPFERRGGGWFRITLAGGFPFFPFLLLSDCRERRWNGGEGKGRNKAPARDVQKLLVQIRTKKAE